MGEVLADVVAGEFRMRKTGAKKGMCEKPGPHADAQRVLRIVAGASVTWNQVENRWTAWLDHEIVILQSFAIADHPFRRP